MCNFLLQENEELHRAYEYFLLRKDDGEGLYIIVHEVLTGDNQGQFTAFPKVSLKNRQYDGRGKTKEEALNNFLNLIKGITRKELIYSDV